MQRLEHRPFHVPVEIVGLEIQRVGIREQARQPLRDRLAFLRLDADFDSHDVSPVE
ncbi:hypothetical protein D3C83_215430 [compost metagenome]